MKFADRREKVRHQMEKERLDAFVLTSEPNVFYLSGLLTSRPPGLIVQAGGESVLLVSLREMRVPSVMEMVDIDRLEGWDRREGGSTQEKVAGILKDLGLGNGRIGYEDDYLTISQVETLRGALPSGNWTGASDITRKLRAVKSPEEQTYIRQAGAVSAEAMAATICALRDGESECNAMAEAERVWRSYGMGAAYEPLIGSGLRSSMLRRFPSQSRPMPGEIVRMDFAAKYAFASGYAYHTDITRCIVMGEPTERQREQLDLTLKVQQKALDGIRPGRKISEVSREALSLVEGTQFEGLCSMGGHGLGLEIHEWPGFNETVDVELQAGMALAVEPSIVIAGGEGVCIEDTVLVTETGIESVTPLQAVQW